MTTVLSFVIVFILRTTIEGSYMMYVSLVFMLLVLAAALAVIVKFTFLIKESVMHNRCHTDNMQIRDLHGHTEPHV